MMEGSASPIFTGSLYFPPVTSRNSLVYFKKFEDGCYIRHVCYICARQKFRRQKTRYNFFQQPSMFFISRKKFVLVGMFILGLWLNGMTDCFAVFSKLLKNGSSLSKKSCISIHQVFNQKQR